MWRTHWFYAGLSPYEPKLNDEPYAEENLQYDRANIRDPEQFLWYIDTPDFIMAQSTEEADYSCGIWIAWRE